MFGLSTQSLAAKKDCLDGICVGDTVILMNKERGAYPYWALSKIKEKVISINQYTKKLVIQGNYSPIEISVDEAFNTSGCAQYGSSKVCIGGEATAYDLYSGYLDGKIIGIKKAIKDNSSEGDYRFVIAAYNEKEAKHIYNVSEFIKIPDGCSQGVCVGDKFKATISAGCDHASGCYMDYVESEITGIGYDPGHQSGELLFDSRLERRVMITGNQKYSLLRPYKFEITSYSSKYLKNDKRRGKFSLALRKQSSEDRSSLKK